MAQRESRAPVNLSTVENNVIAWAARDENGCIVSSIPHSRDVLGVDAVGDNDRIARLRLI